MSKYKLTYFDGMGLAERARFLFAIAKVDYEDERIKFDDLSKMKGDGTLQASMGRLPILEVDGVKIPQSKSIDRFLAKKFGLLGGDPIEEARIDSVSEHQRDLRDAFGKVDGMEKGEEKDKKIKEFFEGKFMEEMGLIEKALPGDAQYVCGPFIFGAKICYADLAWFQFLVEFFTSDEEKAFVAKALESCLRFKTAMEAVEKHPEISEWRAKRPKTQW